MKRFIIPFISILLIASGCDNPMLNNQNESLDSPELQALSDGLVSDLGLNRSAADGVNTLLYKHGKNGKHREPGFVWKIAGELQQTLTEEEKATLFDKMDEHGVDYFGHKFSSKGSKGTGHHGVKMALQAVRKVLTDEQIAVFDEIVNTYKEQFKSLFEQVKSGALSREEAKTQAEALGEAMKAEIEALLTEEQKAELEQMKADFEAKRDERREERQAYKDSSKQVMIEILDMTGDQVASFESVVSEKRESMQALVDQLKNGEIDRTAFREAAKLLFESRSEKMEAIFNDTQLEIIKIHKALLIRMKKNHGKKGGKFGGHGGGQGQRGSK